MTADRTELSTTDLWKMSIILLETLKEPQLPQEAKSALSLPVDSISQSVVQVNTGIFMLLHHLHFFFHDGNAVFSLTNCGLLVRWSVIQVIVEASTCVFWNIFYIVKQAELW